MQPLDQQPTEQPTEQPNAEWQQPHEAPAQAPFQHPEDPEASPSEQPVTEVPTDEQSVSDDSTDTQPSDADILIRWDAPEYAQHTRGTGWYVIFGAATIIITVIAILLIHSITFAILVPVMAVAIFIYTRRAPEVIHYTLSRKGLHINDKLYPYAQFKSFGVLNHNGNNSVVITPRKRFQLGQTLYFPTEVGEKLVDMLASRLPMKEVQPDAIDRLLARLHL